jgi:hypothetical protein
MHYNNVQCSTIHIAEKSKPHTTVPERVLYSLGSTLQNVVEPHTGWSSVGPLVEPHTGWSSVGPFVDVVWSFSLPLFPVLSEVVVESMEVCFCDLLFMCRCSGDLIHHDVVKLFFYYFFAIMML